MTELLETAVALPLTLALALTDGNAKELTLALGATLALALALELCLGPVQNFWKNDCPSVTPVKSCEVAAYNWTFFVVPLANLRTVMLPGKCVLIWNVGGLPEMRAGTLLKIEL